MEGCYFFLSLFLYQHNTLQAEVEEHHSCVGVLHDLCFGTGKLLGQFLYVPLVDERGELGGELLLVGGLIAQ